MATSHIKYLGNLRTECTHLASGTKILTDAPTDNKGKGEVFSPTDLVATSFASCMITIMGIYCQEHSIDFSRCEATITKIMESNPRRISKIIVQMDLNGNNWDEKTKTKVLAAGKACPVAKTLNDGVEIEFDFV